MLFYLIENQMKANNATTWMPNKATTSCQSKQLLNISSNDRVSFLLQQLFGSENSRLHSERNEFNSYPTYARIIWVGSAHAVLNSVNCFKPRYTSITWVAIKSKYKFLQLMDKIKLILRFNDIAIFKIQMYRQANRYVLNVHLIMTYVTQNNQISSANQMACYVQN